MTVAAKPAAVTRAIATPEGLLLPFEIAPTGDRIVAFTIDALIIVGVTVAAWVLAILALGGGASAGALGVSVALLVSFAFRNFYFAFLETARGGSTVGKRLVGICVIAVDGGPLTASALIARNLTRDLELFLPLAALTAPESLVPGAPGWGAVAGVLWILVFAFVPLANADRRRVGDLIAGTIVVRTPKPMLLADLVQAGDRAAESFSFTTEQLELYGIKELQVLEDVLRRHDAGTHDDRVLEAISAKIRKKIRWTKPLRPGESLPFLRAFYAAQRTRLEQKLLFGTRQESKRR